jgi:hypothetical protein
MGAGTEQSEECTEKTDSGPLPAAPNSIWGLTRWWLIDLDTKQKPLISDGIRLYCGQGEGFINRVVTYFRLYMSYKDKVCF